MKAHEQSLCLVYKEQISICTDLLGLTVDFTTIPFCIDLSMMFLHEAVFELDLLRNCRL